MKIIKTLLPFAIVALVASLLANNIIITILKDIDMEQNKASTDDIVLSYLEKNDIIKDDDFYQNFQKIGNHKRYIYSSFDRYYYIEIETLVFKKDGIYEEYEYKAKEPFVVVKIQNCEYNISAQFMDNLITETYGEITTYIFDIKENNVVLKKSYTDQ